MYDFIKKNIYLIFLFIITLSIGFLTFLTFIDKSLIELSSQNLQYLLILNIVLLAFLFIFITMALVTGTNDLDLLLSTLFQTVSFITTTGFTSQDHSLMPLYIPYIPFNDKQRHASWGCQAPTKLRFPTSRNNI